jgi:stalled ribosome rescue protein Dom34
VNTHYHALIWIDHREAKVFQFNATDVERTIIPSTHPEQHLHHKANSGDSGHAPVDTKFLSRVSDAVSKAGAILITGPAGAKVELRTFIEMQHPELAKHISGIQTVDHLSDGELLNLGRSFFKADDRMHSQTHR